MKEGFRDFARKGLKRFLPKRSTHRKGGDDFLSEAIKDAFESNADNFAQYELEDGGKIIPLRSNEYRVIDPTGPSTPQSPDQG